MIANPLLHFVMQLDNTPALNMGRLFLIDPDQRGMVGRWVATSGLGNYQGVGGWSRQGGGCIPPTYQLSGNLSFYSVSTVSIWQDMNGLQSNTYKISPELVTTREGTQRSELLIHHSRFSHPMSGSLGCIVLPEDEFSDFEKCFKSECGHLSQVKLLVGYTYDF
jgi:hypothetical protein